MTELQKKRMEWFNAEFGDGTIEALAEEIKIKSKEISDECIQHTHVDMNNWNTRKRVIVKSEQLGNSTCVKLAFEGGSVSKMFQVRQFDRFTEKTGSYSYCSESIVSGHDPSLFKSWSRPYRSKYKKLEY